MTPESVSVTVFVDDSSSVLLIDLEVDCCGLGDFVEDDVREGVTVSVGLGISVREAVGNTSSVGDNDDDRAGEVRVFDLVGELRLGVTDFCCVNDSVFVRVRVEETVSVKVIVTVALGRSLVGDRERVGE